MHLIGRNSESSARLQLAFQGEQRRFADVAEKHVRFLHVIQRRIERGRDGFLHQAFAQTDPEIARQDLDHILSFARRKFREARLENLGLGQRPAGFLQATRKTRVIR